MRNEVFKVTNTVRIFFQDFKQIQELLNDTTDDNINCLKQLD